MKNPTSILPLFCLLISPSIAFPQALADTRTIAKEAFIYGFPMVASYETMYKQAVDKADPAFIAPFNTVGHSSHVATPEDKQFVTPNSDTPYSYLWMDLRAEPMVITMPKIEKDRYYTAQLIDLYTFNFGYLGTRAFGNDGGDFLITGPGWKGEKPQGVKAVIPSETEFAYALFRTQLLNPADMDNVKAIQAGYKVQPLSKYVGNAAPQPAPVVNWPKPLKGMTETSALFVYTNFLLQFCPTHPSEKELMARFATIGVGAGKAFDAEKLPAETRKAMGEGIADAWKDFAAERKAVDDGKTSSANGFGSREFLKNNYLRRFLAAKLGIYGNSKEEAIYPAYFVDADKQPLDAAKGKYVLRFEKDQLPPAGAFWSLTMYDGKTQHLVANPLKRYLLNSTMLKSFKYGDDDSLTLLIQKDSPGADQEPNWLPAPEGTFYTILRIYMPKPEALNGMWRQPALKRQAAEKETGAKPDVRAIAKEAYIYGFPLVDQYRIMYSFSVDTKSPEYKGPFNTVLNIARVFTPDDKAFVTPNSDTPYSFLGLDLRAEAVVLTLPAVEKERYYVFQMMDLYTFNFDYLGSRTTGNGGGNFLIAGPTWKGETPQGITKVIRSETDFVSVVGRTQMFNPADLENVKKIQSGYKVQPLSTFLGMPSKASPEINWLKPLTPAEQRSSIQ